MPGSFSHASGIIISTACGRLRPARCSSSSTSSKLAESDASGVLIGKSRLMLPGRFGDWQQRLAGRHPVLVAADRVDLTVVRDEPVRVRQRPGRERVRREPGVHQRDRAVDPLVGQVREERRQLVGGEHALVRDGARGQRREVRRRRRAATVSRSACLRMQNATRSSSRPLSGSPAWPAGESVSRCAARNTCRIAGRAVLGGRAQPVGGSTGTSRQPSTSPPSTRAYFSKTLIARAASAGVGRQEDQTGGVRARRPAARSR